MGEARIEDLTATHSAKVSLEEGGPRVQVSEGTNVWGGNLGTRYMLV